MPGLPRPLRQRTPTPSSVALAVLLAAVALLVAFTAATSDAPVSAQPAEPDVSDTQTWKTAAPNLAFLDKADTTCDGTANERYIQPGGKNHPWPQGGSSSQPWATIQFAMKELQPGQTGCVQPGTYVESNLKPQRSGEADKPIVIRADGAVTIHAPDDNYTFTFDTNAPTPTIEYWVVEGFTIDKQDRDNPAIHHDFPAVNIFGGANGRASYIAVRDNEIRNSKANSAVLIRGRVTDVLVYDNDIYGHQRWQPNGQRGPNVPTEYTDDPVRRPDWGRFDANAVDIQGTQLGTNLPSVERIRVQLNRMRDNGGDGVQCQGGEADGANQPLASDPADIDLVDNRVVNTPGSHDPTRDAIEENAFDIKSCKRVTIRGTDPPDRIDPPDRPVPAVVYSKAGEFLPTQRRLDWKTTSKPADCRQPKPANPEACIGGNNDPGTAIGVHFNARQVRIENTRIWAACQAISVGRDEGPQVEGLVIRRVLIFGVRYRQGPTTEDATRCRGRAIQLTNTNQVDLYHNTIVETPAQAIRVTRVGDSALTSNDVDVWNNVLTLQHAPATMPVPPSYWIELGSGVNGFESDYNLFWHQDDQDPAGRHFLLRGVDKNLTEWRASTPWDRDRPPPAGSTWGDPQWILHPHANDFFTQRTSPARDAAKDNTGAQFCDTDLQPDPDAGAPDLGFRESCVP